MSFTLCSSLAIIRKAGANASSTAVASAALLSDFCDEAESSLCLITRRDWIADYSSISANFKPAIADIVSDLAAMKIINYDMSGFTSRAEAQTMLNVIFDNLQRNLGALKPKENQDVII